MRKFILVAGFALASAAAQAGDRSLSLAGSETSTVAAPAKAAEPPKTAEAPQAVEAPKAEAPRYIERPAVVEPKAENKAENKTDAPKIQAAKVEQPAAEPQDLLRGERRQCRGARSLAGNTTGPKRASSANCIGTGSIGKAEACNAKDGRHGRA
jgi:hypothetical protein